MWQARRVTLRALVVRRRRDLVLRPTLVTPRARLLLLWNGHLKSRKDSDEPSELPEVAAKRIPAYSFDRSSPSFAQRGSGPLSCRCSSGSTVLRSTPQTEHRPRQSSRQSRRGGSARTSASRTQLATAVLEIGAVELLGVPRLLDLPSVDADHRRGIGETARAGARKRGLEAQMKREAGRGARDVDAGVHRSPGNGIGLATRLYRGNPNLGVEASAATVGQVQRVDVERVGELRHQPDVRGGDRPSRLAAGPPASSKCARARAARGSPRRRRYPRARAGPATCSPRSRHRQIPAEPCRALA
jgi:hypothetical protein